MVEALIGATGVLAGSLLTWMLNRRKDLTSAYQALVSAQGDMKRQIDAQDQKIDGLIKNRDQLQYTVDLETAYIRALGHWMDSACRFIDPEFVIENPKPHLPDELRDSVGLVHITYEGSDETPR